MIAIPLLLLSLSTLASQTPHGERTNRPQAPYSLPPSASVVRPGSEHPTPVPAQTSAAVPIPVQPLSDGVPLPEGPVVRTEAGGDVVEQPASGDPYFLGFAAGPYRPAAGERLDPELLAQAMDSYPDGRPSADTYAFAMFSKRMTPERFAQLEALGCRTLGFHPHYTQKLALPVGAIDAVAALDFVRWLGVPKRWQRVHPALSSALEDATTQGASAPIQVWISVYESDLGSESVQRLLDGGEQVQAGGAPLPSAPRLLEDVWVRAGWQQEVLELGGVKVIDYSERVTAFRAEIAPGDVEFLTSLDFVQFVELDTFAAPNHDESMAMVNADDSRRFFTGTSNNVALGGIVDSGVELSHADLFSKNASGIDLSGGGSAFDDTCGHGTHVGGSMFGGGVSDPSLMGAAPGLGLVSTAPVQIARIFATCAPQPVDEAAVVSWMESPFNKPHVINNSWSTPPIAGLPWIGSEIEARIYDDSAYNAAQLNVFSAGNSGSAAQTIGLQPAAKNVLTVGSVLDYDDFFEGNAGELTSSSSRGPTGDGRWKPNLVAPGQWIESCDGFDLDDYTEMSGTSMAAPHVAGLAADLIDSDSSFAFLPEKVSAHLMATAVRKNNTVITLPSETHLNTYGAGRIDGTSAIWDTSTGVSTDWAFSLAAGNSTSGDFDVPVGTSRLVVVMHYVEPSASTGASSALVNDWDLYLDQPPLQAGNNTGEWFAQQSSVDNTEMRVFPSPTPGTWRWKAWPESTSSTAFFGVTVYVESGDTTPSILPNFTASEAFAAPGEVVRFDYTAATSGTTLSALKLELATSGATLATAGTLLKDGVWTDLLDNQANGFEVMLGNIHPLFSRSARWDASWATEGVKTFSVSASADNAGNFAQTQTSTATVTVDGTPPMNVSGLVSTSHTPNVWINDATIDMVWAPAFDGVSGLAGYSHSVTTSPSAPTTIQTLGPVTNLTVTTFIGNGAYFNIRAVDNAGNWSPFSAFAGPYLIDIINPTAVGNLTSSSNTPNVLSCSAQLDLSWTAATDFDSGIAGYGVVVDNSPLTQAPTTFTTGLLNYTTTLPSGTWYAHVRALDIAGNAGPTLHLGPFPIELDNVSTYCTAKTNSQGCEPFLTTSGSPSLSGGGLSVEANKVLNNKTGLLFWGTQPSSNPFQGGTKCVANPVKRTVLQDSGGNPPPDDCSGAYKFVFEAAYMSGQGVSIGDTLYAQYWSRDPSAPFTTGLTDAIKFTVCQ